MAADVFGCHFCVKSNSAFFGFLYNLTCFFYGICYTIDSTHAGFGSLTWKSVFISIPVASAACGHGGVFGAINFR